MRHVPLLLLLCGCPRHGWDRYPAPVAIETPIAIPGINSPYDDFNSIDARRLYRRSLIFSTNRGSEGKHYDLYEATVQWATPYTEHSTAPLTAAEPTPYEPELMSDGNERGPIMIDGLGSRRRLVFATDRPGGAGGLDLVSCEDGYKDLRMLSGLNSAADDAYLTRPFVNRELPFVGQKLLFASNRADGKHNDIYAAIWDYRDMIDAAPSDISRVEELSSPADDTAPFVYELANGDVEVVFVSTRAGALGEHDLYCARFADTRSEEQRAAAKARRVGPWDYRDWTAPVHLRELSSARDEYRPIVVDVKGSRYLIFSSTRAGGQGGYDLYVVGYAGCPNP